MDNNKKHNLPDDNGPWWYEFADYPVIVKMLDGVRKAYFSCGWLPVTEVCKGWWIGPLEKPNFKESRENENQ